MRASPLALAFALLALAQLAAASIPLYGTNVCTGTPLGPPWNKVVVPPACRTALGDSKADCATKMTLWQTHFPYCCPFAAGWQPSPGDTQPTLAQGVGAAPSWLVSLLGGKLVSWRGGVCAANSKPVGCAVFYDCASSPCKAACTGMGPGLCTWTGTACIEKPAVVNQYFCTPTLNPTNPDPRLGPCETRSPTTGQPTQYPTTGSPTPKPTSYPTAQPTSTSPTPKPTNYPTDNPTHNPTTLSPTSTSPTPKPTNYPTDNPTPHPTTSSPTPLPTNFPTAYPTTAAPASPTVALYGPNVCTGTPLGGVWSQVIVPPACRTAAGDTKADCATKMTLWQTHFPYCCPYAAGWEPSPGKTQPTLAQGVGAAPSWLVSLLGGKLVSWRGGVCAANSQPVGCGVFYDCASSPCKAACTGMGPGLCTWTGVACIEKPAVVNKYFCAPTISDTPRLVACNVPG